jgi:hypothetical protein
MESLEYNMNGTKIKMIQYSDMIMKCVPETCSVRKHIILIYSVIMEVVLFSCQS